MTNSTNSDASITTTGTTFLGGLSQVEVVVVGTVGAICLLAAVSVFLRVAMPILKHRKKKIKQKKAMADDKNGNLLVPGTPSSQLSSVSTMQSSLDEYSDSFSEKTKTPYPYQTNQPSKAAGLYSYYRPQPQAKTTSSISCEQMNDDLISVIPHQTNDALEPLNLAATYRDNWDQQFSQITRCHSTDGLCYIAHPSENPDLTDTYKTYFTTQQSNLQYGGYRPETHQQAFTKL